MTPERNYIASVSYRHRKRFAQFFTPEMIAKFMCEWVLQGNNVKSILEPAYGLGVFSRILQSEATDVKVEAYELDPVIIDYAETCRPEFVTLRNEDFLLTDWNRKYDAILCNPPYFKFHDYDNTKYIPEVNTRLGVHLNGFTNIYSLFLLKSIAQLNAGGRLAFIIPLEFLNSDYGVEVKRALLGSKTLTHIIIVDFTECAFDEVLTTACIILCDNSNKSQKVRFSTVTNISDLWTSFDESIDYCIDELDVTAKWKRYYEDVNSSKYNHLVPFSTFAKVSRGIATGANDYFIFNLAKAKYYGLPAACLSPCICKRIDVDGQFFTSDDFDNLSDLNRYVYLFDGCNNEENQNVASYIRYGIDKGVNKRYLTASRSPWYSIENRQPAPIWVSVFNRNGLRFVRNMTNIRNLTTFHCVYPKDDIVDVDILFSYLITEVAQDLFQDNSRQYANGLVKFEPNDINRGLCVDLRMLTDEEKYFIRQLYALLSQQCDNEKVKELLSCFFKLKYTVEDYNLAAFKNFYANKIAFQKLSIMNDSSDKACGFNMVSLK